MQLSNNSPEENASQSQTALSFEAAVEKYHARIFQLAFRYLGNYDEASDLTQETFIRAFRAWDNFRGDSQVFTWLYRIALNLCHNQQKKLQRRMHAEGISLDAPKESSSGDEGDQTLDIADSSAMPWRNIERRELNQRLFTALQSLPENYRTVIVLRDIEGLSYEEIANVTSSSLEAIKSRLFRARNLLRQRMSAYVSDSGENSKKQS